MTDWRRNTEMRRYQIRITELAEEDIENAGDYIAHELKNPSAAGNTVVGFVPRKIVWLIFQRETSWMKMSYLLNWVSEKIIIAITKFIM